jgi:hypothetical protein
LTCVAETLNRSKTRIRNDFEVLSPIAGAGMVTDVTSTAYREVPPAMNNLQGDPVVGYRFFLLGWLDDKIARCRTVFA